MRRAVVVLAAAWGAACFTKPAFNGAGASGDAAIGDGDTDAPPDAEMMMFLDAPQASCTSLYADTFNPAAGDPCAPWAVTATPSDITIARQGVLAMTLPQTGGGSGGCISGDFLLANRVSIQLAQAL